MDQFLINFLKLTFSLLPMVILGIYGFKRLNMFYKLFWLQAIVALLLYAIIAANYHAFNHIMFNGYIVVEYALLMGANLVVFTTRKERLWIITGFMVFIIAFALDLMLRGPDKFANHAAAVGAIPVLIFNFVLIYRYSTDKVPGSIIWMCLGLILYFCGTAPFLALMIYLQKEHSALSGTLQTFILEPLGHLRYLLAGVSFWIVLREYSRASKTDSTWKMQR